MSKQDHKTSRNNNWFFNSLLWVSVAIALVILYQQFARPDASLRDIVTGGPVSVKSPKYDNYEAAFDDFFTALNAQRDIQGAHQHLSAYLVTLGPLELPTRLELEQYLKNKSIPGDYQYFFEECLVQFTQARSRTGRRYSGENILLSLPPGNPYKASYFINQKAIDFNQLNNEIDLRGTDHRLVMSAIYTSPLAMPVGLNLLKGEVINPAIQKFDGLILIDKDGQISLTHIDQLEYNLKPFNIRTSFADYLAFLKIARKDGISVMQSHLILNNGNILIQDNTKGRKMRRRVLFKSADGGIHVYDSLEDRLSLFEVAKQVKEQYQAAVAINLDMGDFNFCTLNTPEQFKNLSQLKPSTILSNLLIIDF